MTSPPSPVQQNMQPPKNIQMMKWFNFFSWFRPYSPIAILYFADITGSFASAFLVFSIFSVATSVFEIPTGIFSDKIGRRKTLILGSGASVLSILFYAIGGSFWILVVGAIFAGLQDAFFSGNNDALIYDTLSEAKIKHEYEEHFGNIKSILQIALGVSALLGGIVGNFSYAWVFWLSVIPQVLSLLVSFQIEEPKLHSLDKSGNVFDHLRDAFLKFKTNYKLRNLSLSSILGFGMGEVEHQFMPAFITSVWPVWGLGISRAMDKFFSSIGSRYAGRVLKRFSTFKVLIVGEAFGIATTLVAVLFPSIASPVLIAMTSIPFGITAIALSSLMQTEFSDQQRATMGSINSLFSNIFFAVFAYLFGFVADHLGARSPIIITQILTLSIVYIYWKLFRSHRNEIITQG